MSHRVTKLMQQDDRLNRLIDYLGNKEYDKSLFESAINATGQFIDWEVDMWSIPLNKSVSAATRAIRFVALSSLSCISIIFGKLKSMIMNYTVIILDIHSYISRAVVLQFNQKAENIIRSKPTNT